MFLVRRCLGVCLQLLHLRDEVTLFVPGTFSTCDSSRYVEPAS